MNGREDKVQQLTDKIVREYHPQKVILFGSYAWGTPTEDSDLDFFVVKETGEPAVEREVSLRRILFGSGVPIDVLVYTPEEVAQRREIDDPFIEEVLSKGKVLYEAATQ